MKKIISFAALFLAVSILLCACSGTAGDTEAASTEALTEKEVSTLDIVKDGVTQYKIVRDDECSDELTDACVALRRAMKEKYGIDIQIDADFELPTYDISKRSPYEILVGNTNRDETAEAKKELGYRDSVIKVIGTRVVIAGGCDEATLESLEAFTASIAESDELVLASDYEKRISYEYDAANAAIDGVSLSEFTIVYGSGMRSTASTFASRIGEKTGCVLSVASDSTDRTEHELVILSKKRETLKTFDSTEDFEISVRDGSVYISGGSSAAAAMGCAEFLSLLAGGADTASALNYSYTLPDRQEYINDISKLQMRWALDFEPEDWLLDFDEKYAAFTDPNGRMISCLHRGDSNYYPENSVEGYISAIKMGADMIELDPRLTKDGVFVLMHDATLTRMTDFSQKAGKNGLPTSANLEDWTYEQLQQLNLKSGNGGDSAAVTEFKIPTLDEAVHVCAGHVFIRLDVKGPESGVYYWDYEKDIWPLEVKYSSYDNILFTWHSVFYKNSYALVKKYKALQTSACGRSGVHILACSANRSASEVINILKTTKFEPVVRLTDVDWSEVGFDEYVEKNADKLNALKGKVRIYSDAQASGNNMKENAEWWDKLYSWGFSAILVNESVSFVRYIQENYSPAEY